MKIFSLKNYVSLYNKHCNGGKLKLVLKGLETEKYYTFIISDEYMKLYIGEDENNFDILMSITDIFHLNLADENFKPIFMIEYKYKKDGEPFEECKKWIQYPAQLYITLFNIMDKLANFIISHDGIKEECTYLSGKVFLIQETEDEYIVRGTNLNHLYSLFGEYEILYVWDMYKKISYSEFLDSQEKIAKNLNKPIVKYKLDTKVGG